MYCSVDDVALVSCLAWISGNHLKFYQVRRIIIRLQVGMEFEMDPYYAPRTLSSSSGDAPLAGLHSFRYCCVISTYVQRGMVEVAWPDGRRVPYRIGDASQVSYVACVWVCISVT